MECGQKLSVGCFIANRMWSWTYDVGSHKGAAFPLFSNFMVYVFSKFKSLNEQVKRNSIKLTWIRAHWITYL